MFKIDLNNKLLNKVDSTVLKSENLLERQDLQQFIYNSWENFKNEIGLPTAILIGQEIKPHDSVQDSIDLLAFDQDDSSLIVIELKREKNKLQLLQAISYAAMVATWDSEKLIKEVSRNIKNQNSNEALEIIKNIELNEDIKIVLIAEHYDPEVILTAEWLSKKHDLNITAFTVRIHKDKEQLFLEVDQKYPLPELSESYESRRKNKPGNKLSSEITWEQIIPKLEYSFAEKGIAICRKLRGEGNPSLRRFGNIVVNQDGFSWISLNFRVKYINVYAGTDDKQSSIQKLKDIFGDAVDVSEWRDGVSFSISTENDFNKLIKWMKLG